MGWLPNAEAAEWATAVAQIAGDVPPSGLHDAWALCQLVVLVGQWRNLGRAHQQLDRALKLVDPHARRPDMTGTAAMSYSRAGCLAEQAGDLDEAARWHAKALAMLAGGSAVLLPSNPR